MAFVKTQTARAHLNEKIFWFHLQNIELKTEIASHCSVTEAEGNSLQPAGESDDRDSR